MIYEKLLYQIIMVYLSLENHVLWAWSEFNGYAAEVLGSG